MSLSNTVRKEPTEFATCDNHKTGNGRQCEWISDSEYYSTNTMDGNVTVTNQ